MYRITSRSVALIVFETALILLAVAVAAYWRLSNWAWYIAVEEDGIAKAVLVAGVIQACLYYADLYDLRLVADRRELFLRIAQALGASGLILAIVYYWFPGLIIGRGVFFISAVLITALVFLWRVTFGWVSRKARPSERLLLVGTSQAAITLARELYERRDELGVEIVGFVDPDPQRLGAPVLNPGVIGTVEDIPSIVRARGVDRVVVSLADARGKLPMDKLLEMRLGGTTFDHLASVYERYTGKIALENLRPSWFIFSGGFRKSRLLVAAKRSLDLLFAGVGLVLTLPLMGIIAIAVRASSSGPAMYHQQRVGYQGRIFTVHKFRTMCDDAEAKTGPVWAAKEGDARITWLGSRLRRARLDELPQLWNVLKGEMSFVGPRPERPEFVTELTRDIQYYGQRHVIRPGLTGWAQVRYTYGASTEDALQKLQYDLFYIKNLSIALDLFIVFATIKTVILRKGA